MAKELKPLDQIIAERRATPSFSDEPVEPEDLERILEAGRHAPSGYNMQPWRFIVVRSAAQKKKLRAVCFNQAKVEEAPVVIVACGDADGWRSGDLEEVLREGREGGMPESYAAQVEEQVPHFLANLPDMEAWLNRQVMIAFTHMMLMAEALGYDTAPMEGCEFEKVHDMLRLPLRFKVVALLAIGKRQGKDKFNGQRFPLSRTTFEEEYPKPFKP